MINLAPISAIYNQTKTVNGIPPGYRPPSINPKAMGKILKSIGYVFLAPLFLLTGCRGFRYDKNSVPSLIEGLNDKNPEYRREAALALSEIGPEAAASVPALINAFKDSDWTVREAAADALGKIKVGAVPALINALKDNDQLVRWGAQQGRCGKLVLRQLRQFQS